MMSHAMTHAPDSVIHPMAHAVTHTPDSMISAADTMTHAPESVTHPMAHAVNPSSSVQSFNDYKKDETILVFIIFQNY